MASNSDRKLVLSSAVTPSQVSQLFRLVFLTPYPLVKLAKFLRIDTRVLYRFLQTEHGKAFFRTFHHKDKFGKSRGLWVGTNNLNLIVKRANLKPVSIERRNSINRVTEVKEFGYYDSKKRKYVYTNDIYKKNNVDFANYKINCNHKALWFCKNPKMPDSIYAPNFLLPYVTRFTDKVRQHETRDKYLNMWKVGAERYNKAVMVTLTVNPEKIENLWEGNKRFMEAMHKFHNFIKKRVLAEKKRVSVFDEMYLDFIKGNKVPDIEYLSRNNCMYLKRLYEQISRNEVRFTYQSFKEHLNQNWIDAALLKKGIEEGYKISQKFKNIPSDYEFTYLNVLEFQKNGRLHSHMVIFGLEYLMSTYELGKLWDSYGMGHIVHAYALKRNSEGSFNWGNSKPTDTRNKKPESYLMEYLLKAQYTTACNYWTFNTRFYTNSRNFEDSELKALERKLKRTRPAYWCYMGSIKIEDPLFKRISYLSVEDYLKKAGVVAFNNIPCATTPNS